MSEQTLLVLTALAQEELYGYAIIQAAEELSEGRVRLRVGTLYGVLDRLEAEHLVEPSREEVHQGRLRRYYRITQPGIDALTLEAGHRAELARKALDRTRGLRAAPEGGGA
jgi:DNA-binding PadR family transcriptional regulator